MSAMAPTTVNGFDRASAECIAEAERVLETAYEEHRDELERYARARLGDPHLAEDVVSETFLRAFRGSHHFDIDRGPARSWLYAILRNLLVDRARARASRPEVVVEDVTTAAEPSEADAVDRAATRMALTRALQELAPQHRDAIVAVHYQDMSLNDAAERLGVPVGTVKSRLYYGLRSLRAQLEESGWSAA
jgi:RNA polymerase sigma-70 factor, ECF subfamily